MKQACDMGKTVRSIRDNQGNHVRITTNLGRNRSEVVEGTITETYSEIFIVKLDHAEDTIRTQSYNYFDLITKDVMVEFA